MRTDDIIAIRGKLREDGICSPKKLIDCAGWANEAPQRYMLAEVMQYLIEIGEAKKVPQGFQALDLRGNPRPLRRGAEMPPKCDFDIEMELKKESKIAAPTGSSSILGRRHSDAAPFDREKAHQIVLAIESGEGFMKGCESSGVPLEVAKYWRKRTPEFDDRVKLAIKAYGNSPTNTANMKHQEIERMLRAGASYRKIVKAVACGKTTVLKVAARLHLSGVETNPVGRPKKAKC